MHELFPLANTNSAIQSRYKSLRAKEAIREFLQPGVLSVLALALFVAGWSYGHKLSHYLPNTSLTKASTTRMWLDQRQASIAAPVQHQQGPQKFLTLALCFFSVPALPHFSREQILAESPKPHAVEFVSPLHPLRAPPISSSLA